MTVKPVEDVREDLTKLQNGQSGGDDVCLRYLPDIIKRSILVFERGASESCVQGHGLFLPSDVALRDKEPIYDLLNSLTLLGLELGAVYFLPVNTALIFAFVSARISLRWACSLVLCSCINLFP